MILHNPGGNVTSVQKDVYRHGDRACDVPCLIPHLYSTWPMRFRNLPSAFYLPDAARLLKRFPKVLPGSSPLSPGLLTHYLKTSPRAPKEFRRDHPEV